MEYSVSQHVAFCEEYVDQRRSLIRKSLMYTVASHRDAWIKGIRAYALALDTPSHPARMRGFKVICHFFLLFKIVASRVGCVD